MAPTTPPVHPPDSRHERHRPEGTRRERLRERRHRLYAYLLLITVAVMVGYAMPEVWSRLSFLGHMLLTLILSVELGGVVSWEHRSRHLFDRLYRWLGFACLGTQLIWKLSPEYFRFSGLPLLVLFSLFMGWSLKRLVGCLSREQRVGSRVVAGALAGYLLLGISGGLLLSVLATINPPGFVNYQQAESFVLPEKSDSQQSLEARRIEFININYFAFVSLTTVGYGDIVPVMPSTKMASVALSVAGPFYIAVVMGVLISRLSQMEEPPPGGGRDR